MSREYFIFQGKCECIYHDRLILSTKNFRYVFNIKDNHIFLETLKKIKADDIVTVRAYTENRYGSHHYQYLDKITEVKRKKRVIIASTKGRYSK